MASNTSVARPTAARSAALAELTPRERLLSLGAGALSDAVDHAAGEPAYRSPLRDRGHPLSLRRPELRRLREGNVFVGKVGAWGSQPRSRLTASVARPGNQEPDLRR